MLTNNKVRCAWSEATPLYVKYHDEEWGVPLHDEKKLFEFLTLEAFQAGLSWLIILNKRENFEKAFAGFDFEKVAKFNDEDVARLVNDEGIVRNRQKIQAAINNANCFIDLIDEFGSFNKYIWKFVNGVPVQNNFTLESKVPGKTTLSDEISLDLKSRGFKFVGSTVVYAHMQATGMVNDHVISCFRHKELS